MHDAISQRNMFATFRWREMRFPQARQKPRLAAGAAGGEG